MAHSSSLISPWKSFDGRSAHATKRAECQEPQIDPVHFVPGHVVTALLGTGFFVLIGGKLLGFFDCQNARLLSSDFDGRDWLNGIVLNPFAFLEPFEGGIEEATGVVLCCVGVRACVNELGNLLCSDFMHGDVVTEAGETLISQLGVSAIIRIASGLLQ